MVHLRVNSDDLPTAQERPCTILLSHVRSNEQSGFTVYAFVSKCRTKYSADTKLIGHVESTHAHELITRLVKCVIHGGNHTSLIKISSLLPDWAAI